MKGMADGSAAKQQVAVLEQRVQLACEKITWAVLTEREPAASSACRESVPKRRALVEKAVAILRKHAVDPKALEDTPDNPAASAANADLSRLPDASPSEPLNAQSIAAWLPPEADGAKQVYALWLVVQNHRLRDEKWSQDQQLNDPVTPERRKQINETLAANKVRLKRLEKIEDPGEFKTFVEGSVMGQGDAGVGFDASGALGPRGPSGEATDKRPLKVQQSMGGVDRNSIPPPSQPQSPPLAPTDQGADSGLLAKAIGFGGAAGAGALLLWRKKREERELEEARGEVAAEDHARAVAAGTIIDPPNLTKDPVGFVADRAFRAKEFALDHPYLTVAGVGTLAMGGWLLVGPTLLGGGGGLLLTTGEALVPAITLDGVVKAGAAAVVTVAGAKGASDYISSAKSARDEKRSAEKPATPEGGDGKRVTNPSKSESSVWKRLENFKNGIKRSGRGGQTRYYKWDKLHNDIEVFDSRGQHRGSMDPKTGEMYKPPKGHSITSEL